MDRKISGVRLPWPFVQKDSEPEREGEADVEEQAPTTGTAAEAEAEEPATEADDEGAQQALMEELAQAIVERGMAGPAIFVLESMRPVSFVTAEFMVFLEPFARAFFSTEKYSLLYEALHDRRNLTWLVDRLEVLEEQRAAGPDSAGARGPGDGETVTTTAAEEDAADARGDDSSGQSPDTRQTSEDWDEHD